MADPREDNADVDNGSPDPKPDITPAEGGEPNPVAPATIDDPVTGTPDVGNSGDQGSGSGTGDAQPAG